MTFDPKDWVLLPPGNRLLLRRPSPEMLPECRLATIPEIIAANYGAPFPWGHLAAPRADDALWQTHRLGTGGLYHTHWFVCHEGRVGGAPNVPEGLPGSLRGCFYLDGGSSEEGLAENEGYALTRPASTEDQVMYRKVMLHATKHIMADRGHLIVTPITEGNVVHVGFGGRCRTCPNPLLITIQQLQASVPDYTFVPLPEWTS